MSYEQDYATLVESILADGIYRETRNKPTYSLFGKTLFIDELTRGEFPMLSGRKLFHKGVIGEFAAFLHGVKTIEDFEKFGCNYWSKWADQNGNLNVDYGNVWRNFEGFNQLAAVIDQLKADPAGRRHLISGWRPHKLAELSLPCCHLLYQWYVNAETNELEMIWYQRSVDTMVGLPSDVILAALWNCLMAFETGYKPGRIIMMLGDTHIYAPHANNAHEYVDRVSGELPPSPRYGIADGANFDNFNPSHFNLYNYNPLTKLDFEVFE